jgi:UDP-glucuronate 4-epimerase
VTGRGTAGTTRRVKRTQREMKILVTGNAGFIGFHVARRLLRRGDSVVGFDAVNDYYDPRLKESRLEKLRETASESTGEYAFIRANLADPIAVRRCFEEHAFDRVIHLAAQAGVRYSLVNPHAYVESNIVGFTNILEACRHAGVAHLTYASTSSVYGGNQKLPFSEHDPVAHPLQFYAATKRANELMAHSYSHLFDLPTTGLRFFTVYGPWGRPDMALFIFTKNMLAGEPITVFNHGNHTRDFTYVDDIAEGVILSSDTPATPDGEWDAHAPDPASSSAPFRIFNIGNNTRVNLIEYIEAIERALGRKSRIEMLPLQPGDVPDTFADVSRLASEVGYRPSTPVNVGVQKFVDWYISYYGHEGQPAPNDGAGLPPAQHG